MSGDLRPDEYEKDGVKIATVRLHVARISCPLRTTSPIEGHSGPSGASTPPGGSQTCGDRGNSPHAAVQPVARDAAPF
ncbi:hypothetical protein GCM10010357_51480 [Streptomyces luteireticuli]|uniref:Transposase n=1 Tax=Streptomyces luteireticuli TaxID=173858 RepID=A0ABN0YZB9_9ACTN